MIIARRKSVFLAGLALTLVTVSACRVTDLPLWSPGQHKHDDVCEVERVKDIAYHDARDADPLRHKLDFYYPKGKRNFPVVVLVHGGAWMVGDNRCCGLYSSVGEFLASQGISAVLPNYRLSPGVKHPEHVKDVARAFAWTKKNVAKYGGDADQLFLVGHSAGGHLVALLATDEQFLKAVGCKTSDIQGVVGISGVYRILAGKMEVKLGGSSELAVRLDEMAPLRGESEKRTALAKENTGMPVSINIFQPAFGDDAKVRQSASPIHHVRRGLPPFLLLYADKDLPTLPGMAQEMHAALEKDGCKSRCQRIDGRNHNSIIFRAMEAKDPVANAIVEFVRGR